VAGNKRREESLLPALLLEGTCPRRGNCLQKKAYLSGRRGRGRIISEEKARLPPWRGSQTPEFLVSRGRNLLDK